MPEGEIMKVTERSDHAGNCYECGGTIYVGDVIVRDELHGIPIARHAQCDPDFATGGSSK